MITGGAIALGLLCWLGGTVSAKETVHTAEMHHLRVGSVPEWSDFPEKPEGPSLSLTFRARRNDSERTLRLRQRDVKQTWKILLNGKELGRLLADENDAVLCLPVPPGALADGENGLTIEQVGR